MTACPLNWDRRVRGHIVMVTQTFILSTLADQRSELRGDLVNIVIGSILFALGFGALALSAFRQTIKDRSILYFGIFCSLYGLRLLVNSGLIHTSVNASSIIWNYLDAFITYLIPLPSLLFTERFLGTGWK